LHGQTIVVEGAYEEDPSMFVLSGTAFWTIADAKEASAQLFLPKRPFGLFGCLGEAA